MVEIGRSILMKGSGYENLYIFGFNLYNLAIQRMLS